MAQEKQFENRVKYWLTTKGIYPAGYPAQKMTVPAVGWFFKVFGGGFQRAGIPDLILCIRGRFVAVELKAQNGRASELQHLNIARIADADGDACVLFPSGFARFQADIEYMLHTDRPDKAYLAELYK